MAARSGTVRKQVRRWLESGGRRAPADFAALDPARAAKAAMGSLADPRRDVKWRAVTAMGQWTARLADKDPEAARDIMRRLTWALNEESGAVGFGMPEALGEIMARRKPLAGEFINILISYLDPGCNYLDFPPLLKGAVWGLGRAARAHPALARRRGADAVLGPLLYSDDQEVRGLAAWAMAPLGPGAHMARLEALAGDQGRFSLFEDGAVRETTVGEQAAKSAGACDV